LDAVVWPFDIGLAKADGAIAARGKLPVTHGHSRRATFRRRCAAADNCRWPLSARAEMVKGDWLKDVPFRD